MQKIIKMINNESLIKSIAENLQKYGINISESSVAKQIEEASIPEFTEDEKKIFEEYYNEFQQKGTLRGARRTRRTLDKKYNLNKKLSIGSYKQK